jgi:uncharacterized protein (DUF2336 family)
MATTASTALFVELEAAVSGGSSERRVSILRQVTDLFLADAERLSATQVAVFDDVLMKLVERVETRALAQLSKTLSVVVTGPNNSIRHLAFHQEASVAAPVLTKSSVLSDADLIKVANSRGQQHLLAISARKTLNEAVTDVLIERGDNTVVQSLAQNSGARFSANGYSSLVDKAADNEGLTEALGLRLDIPINFLRDLLAKASEAVKARLLKAAPPDLLETIRTAIDSIVEEIGGKPPFSLSTAPAISATRRSIALRSNRTTRTSRLRWRCWDRSASMRSNPC